MHMQVLALADGLHHLADVDAVLDDRVADLVVLERELVADRDVALRRNLDVLVVLHDPAFQDVTGLDALDHDDADAVAFFMDHEMDHGRYSIHMIDRRRFLQALVSLGVIAARPVRAQLNEKPSFARNPFSLGVASGYPQPAGFTLWTRLAPRPEVPGGGMAPEVVPVTWEVAHDEAFKDVVASGTTYATPEWAHSVHAEVTGLQGNRQYWYRFACGDARTPPACTRTAPGFQTRPTRLRFALASCQHYEQGYFNAYRHIATDQPDLMMHVGDYIYESSWGREHVRKHNIPEPMTLEDYRMRYAQYKSDRDLQSAHAACPWLVAAQEQWLEAQLAASRARWNFIVQQTPMAQFDQKPGPGRSAWTDGWDGYPLARRKILDFISSRKIANPVVLGGDVHSFNVNHLKLDFDDPASPIVASEFVGTSITSQAWPQERLAPLLAANPHMTFSHSRLRRHARFGLSRQ